MNCYYGYTILEKAKKFEQEMDEVNKNIYPLKINEYLAVGVPVVMTAFADLADFKDMAKSAENKSLFKSHIENELKNDIEVTGGILEFWVGVIAKYDFVVLYFRNFDYFKIVYEVIK